MATRTSPNSSSSKRHFHWTNKVGNEEDNYDQLPDDHEDQKELEIDHHYKTIDPKEPKPQGIKTQLPKKKFSQLTTSKIRSSVLTLLNKTRRNPQTGLGSRVIGTLFGSKRGHVHFAFQRDYNSDPAFVIELATPISGLVKEMASGLVRIALECDKEKNDRDEKMKSLRLLEEPVWRTFCNGKKYGFATRREYGEKEKKILKAVENISMGAGVLPAKSGEKDDEEEGEEEENGFDGDVMYMRAKFERILGSRDSEAFYMMNPDSNGAPELSIYLLRV